MIKLTLSPNAHPLIWIFDQKVVTIGSGSGPIKADISLPDQELQPIHIKIINEGHRFIAVNFANDPFVTLNDLPFGKKALKNRDQLQIGPHLMLFESEECHNDEKISTQPFEMPLEQLHQDRVSVTESPYLEITEEKTLEFQVTQVEENDATEHESIISLSKTKDETHIEESTPSEITTNEKKNDSDDEESLNKTSTLPTKKHFIEYQLGEFDDESENWTSEKESKEIAENDQEENAKIIPWKMLGTGAIFILLILAIIGSAVYLNMITKNEGEELRAAEGVSDVAMALKYAQVHHIKPQKKNWSDPEFIKKSLAQVIPHDYPSLAKIDQHGHLNNTSYFLRIYTNTDFSQFLVIAQPAPSVLQRIIPKTAIVIDSKLMQLRKVADMKTLNRLLVNSNNLDNSNAVEVTNLVKHGELIPLMTLSKKRKGQDFSPPKALKLLRPGAENYIYNAPRYYQLSETIMKRAIDLMEMPGSAYEMSRLKQDMSLLSKMNDMVLYSSRGIQLTLEAQKAIAAFVSNARFLTAYLKFDSKGMVTGSHLIIDDESSHNQSQEPKPQAIVSKDKELMTESENPPPQLSERHPLLTQLTTLCINRKQALDPLQKQIMALINEDSRSPVNGFETHLFNLIHEYLEVDKMQKQNIARAIYRMAEEYRLIPLEEFMGYLNQSGLGENCKEILKHVIQTEGQETRIQSYIEDIQAADHFKQLEKILSEATRWLAVKNFNDLNQLQIAQRRIKNEVIKRINLLLLSFMPISLELHDDKDQRSSLRYLLQQLLVNLDEQNYYLNEFDYLMMNTEEK